jgi:cytochrome c biogenesis protein
MRNRTSNRVRWQDEAGITREAEIGDIVPLNLHGYRFYTTPNKGFAALIRWQPQEGASEIGSVNFPSFPLHADLQESTWRLGEIDLRLRLPVDPLLIDPDQHGVFKLPARQSLVIESPLLRATLEPGQSMQLPTGRVTYLALTTWMGYQVFYDPTLPWLLAAATLAVAALGWHFWAKFARKPWQPD